MFSIDKQKQPSYFDDATLVHGASLHQNSDYLTQNEWIMALKGSGMTIPVRAGNSFPCEKVATSHCSFFATEIAEGKYFTRRAIMPISQTAFKRTNPDPLYIADQLRTIYEQLEFFEQVFDVFETHKTNLPNGASCVLNNINQQLKTVIEQVYEIRRY